MTPTSNHEHEKKSKTSPKTTLESKSTSLELTDEAEKIRIIKKNIKPDILCIVYNSDALPVTYAAWKTKIVKIGKLQEELDQIQRNRSNQAPPPPSAMTSSTQSKYNITPAAPKKKTMPKGYGMPMDIDHIKNASCFNCGTKGHFCNDCPEPKKKINI
jgi:hypothetical protein